MTFLGRRLSVAIPDTVLEEHNDVREKTVKLGIIARTCAIFGVDSIRIFRDPKGRDESRMIKRVLEYLETPQYLRRSLFGYDDALKYAGLLPPLRIPSHKPKVPIESLKAGELRDGLVLPDGTVDIGLERHLRLNARGPVKGRVTVRVIATSPLSGELVGKDAISEYWGYEVELTTIPGILSGSDFTIATSRYGKEVRAVLQELKAAVGRARGVTLLFGSPSRGLFDIIGKDLVSKVDCVVNLFAEQHVVTVRTEEAISAGLYLINTLSI